MGAEEGKSMQWMVGDCGVARRGSEWACRMAE